MQHLVIIGPDLDMDAERAAMLRAIGLHTAATLTAVARSPIRVEVQLDYDGPLDGLADVLAAHACIWEPAGVAAAT